jgi:hypothetical protein
MVVVVLPGAGAEPAALVDDDASGSARGKTEGPSVPGYRVEAAELASTDVGLVTSTPVRVGLWRILDRSHRSLHVRIGTVLG